MGFMDKVKSAAQDVAAEAKKAKGTAATKMEQSSLRKKQDELAKDLGWLIYRERAEGTPAGTEADRLIGEITSLQAQLDAATAADAGSAEAATPTEAPSDGTTPPGPTTP